MSKPARRLLFLFLLRFTAYFVPAFGLWYVATPVVGKGLAFATEQVVMLCDTYDLTRSIESLGRNVVISYSPSPDGQPHIINQRNLTYNTVFLLALVMAVPFVKIRLRLKILAVALAILYPWQVLRLSVYVLNYYGQHMRSGGESLYPPLIRQSLFYVDWALVRIDGQLTPLIIWASLFYRYLWGKPHPEG